MADQTGEPRRPRIVHRDGHQDPEMNTDEISYLSFNPSDRIDALKEKIAQNEKQLFDLDTAVLMLTGNPGTGVEHVAPDEIADREGRIPTFTPNPRCPCTRCELVRTKKAREFVKYGVTQLRALYSKMLNG